jgi:chemotaxis protein methyltransferase CheR
MVKVRSEEDYRNHREFEFSQEDFGYVVDTIYNVAGISLSMKKENMVYSRLARRLRKLDLKTFSEYLDFVDSDEEEKKSFVNSLTTNLTHFFREEHHFDFLRKQIFPELFSRNLSRIRVWSAGCSTGEEPYTLAMIWEHMPEKPLNVDFKILATDLDTNVLQTAETGIYSVDKLVPVEQPYQRWFAQTSRCSEQQKEISKKLKTPVHFKQLNLMANWPMKGPFQLIICRNVLIYFDKKTQKNLIERYFELLEPGGYLILGHSESLGANRGLFESCGKTIFRKKG